MRLRSVRTSREQPSVARAGRVLGLWRAYRSGSRSCGQHVQVQSVSESGNRPTKYDACRPTNVMAGQSSWARGSAGLSVKEQSAHSPTTSSTWTRTSPGPCGGSALHKTRVSKRCVWGFRGVTVYTRPLRGRLSDTGQYSSLSSDKSLRTSSSSPRETSRSSQASMIGTTRRL